MAKADPISTRNLTPLPRINDLRRLLQSLAMLDAIMSAEWESRYYSFDAGWAAGEQMGSMRNGSGDDYYALFNQAGCFFKGFAHESQMSPYRCVPKQLWPGIFENVPEEFDDALREPAFVIEDTTFCIWRRYEDHEWQRGNIAFPQAPDPDGSEMLLAPLDGDPARYHEFAEYYYERKIDIYLVHHVYRHLPLTDKVITGLNADARYDAVLREADQISYPA